MATEVRLIECRNCDARNCKGCNVYTLSKMLQRGEFDCMMDEHHSIVRAPESLRPKGQWVVSRKTSDGYERHRCSHCGTDAPFVYTYRDNWDKGMDGEWYYLGQIEDGIEEQMDLYCPYCGARMEG